MNMKKRISLLLVFLLCLTGCGQVNTLTETLPMAETEEISVNQEGESYLSDTDNQFFWGRDGSLAGTTTACITKGNGGYYFFDNSLLCFYDPETDSSYPLCARPNCSHDSADCSAYWENYSICWMQYVNDALYLLGGSLDDSRAVLLMRVQADGGTREEIYELFQADSAGVTALIHRGYLYYAINMYSVTEESSATVFRRRLDGTGEAEEIYESEAYYACTIDLRAYGGYLYVQESGYTDANSSDYNGSIERISIYDLTYETLKEGAYLDFAVSGSTLYYDNSTQVIALDTNTKEETVLYETGMPVYMAFDGTNLWLDNDCGIFVLQEAASDVQRTLTVLSEDGTVVQKLPLEEEYLTLLFGDGAYLFAEVPQQQSDGYYDTPICVAKKQDVLNGTLEWSVLYEP